MDDANKSGFKPPPGFQEYLKAPLIQPNTTDAATELWLIQWPIDQVPDFNGRRLSLDLGRDAGQLGTVEGLSGKSYDVVSLAAQEPKAMVFQASAADSKIVGKITRRVSFVHYVEPSEIAKDDYAEKLKQMYERSSTTNSAHHLAKSVKPRQLGRASTHSSARKSSLSEERDGTRKPVNEPKSYTQDKKSKRRKKHEE